jgi:hypothetical protein
VAHQPHNFCAAARATVDEDLVVGTVQCKLILSLLPNNITESGLRVLNARTDLTKVSFSYKSFKSKKKTDLKKVSFSNLSVLYCIEHDNRSQNRIHNKSFERKKTAKGVLMMLSCYKCFCYIFKKFLVVRV